MRRVPTRSPDSVALIRRDGLVERSFRAISQLRKGTPMNILPFTKHNPANGDLIRFRNDFDRTIDRLFNESWGLTEPRLLRSEGWIPAMDIIENETEVTIRAEVPGIAVKDLDINILGNTLTVVGAKDEKKEDKGENYYQCERRFGSFRRVVELPETIDPEKITAEADNGVVTIHVAKKPGMKAKHVPIQPVGKRIPIGT